MTKTSRTFRIFVSSTFSDLKAERNALQQKVFPRLRDLAMSHGCRFQAIDLRWGVSDEAALDQQTMKVCLGEIERCQKTSPRPNFIVLLGDRYGWRPLPYEIPEKEFETILSITSREDHLILNQWYRRDNNAIPPTYVLQPRKDEFANFDVWENMETRLRSILQSSACTLNFSQDALLKYTASATEQEIVNGALKVPNAKEHIFCFLREIQNGPNNNAASNFFETDPQIAGMQSDLKNRLRQTFSNNVHEYSSNWKNDGPSLDHLDQLCEDVYHELSAVISSELERLEEIDQLDREIANHEIFKSERTRIFFGRKEILNAIEKYISSPNNHPLIIHGVSGTGKSALIAKAIDIVQKDGQEIVYRFIGVTPESSNVRALLENLCRQISRQYGVDESSIPVDYKELVDEFPKRLALATQEKPLILFLDALDQLSALGNIQDLAWMPMELPPNVRLVTSTLPGTYLEDFEKTIQEQNRIEIQPMSVKDGESVLDAWLIESRRNLQNDQKKYLLQKFSDCGLPLYLKLSFEEARLWKSYDQIPELGNDISGILHNLFQRLSMESNHGEILVSRSLGYLITSKNGLSEDELVDVLSKDHEVYLWFLNSIHQIPDDLIDCLIGYFQITGTDVEKRRKAEDLYNEKIRQHTEDLNKFISSILGMENAPKLPVVLWSRLFFDLESYLIERDADNSSLLSFFHTTSFRNVISEVFLSDEESIKRHQLLADYFESQPLYQDGEEKQKPNRRKLSEMVFHQASAGLAERYSKTLTDYSYLEAKLNVMGIQELIGDFDLVSLAGVTSEKERTLSLLQDALALAAHILSKDPLQLAGQLTGRLKGFQEGSIQDLLDQIRQKVKYPWLRPLDSHLEAPGGPLIRTLVGHSMMVNNVAITPDNQRIVSVGSKEIKIWDVGNGKCLNTISGHESQIYGIALTSDGLRAITSSMDKTLKVWDLQNVNCLHTLEGHTDQVNSVVITSDNRKAISASMDKTIKIWDLLSGSCIETFTGHTQGVNDVKLTPNGRLIVSAGELSIKIWDLAKGACINTLRGHTNVVRGIAITHDGQQIVSASNDNTLKVWDIESGTCIHTLAGHGKGVESVSITSDDRYAVSVSMDMTLKKWNLENGKCENTLIGHNHTVNHVALTSDDHYAVSASADRTIKIWNLEQIPSTYFQVKHKQQIRAVAMSQDGKKAVSASEDKTLRVWDVESGSCIFLMEGHTDVVQNVVLTHDNQFAVSASADKTLKIWEMKTGKCLLTLDGHTGGVWCLALTHDDRYIVSGSDDKTIKIWDIKTGQCMRTLVGHTFAIRSVILAKNDEKIISTSGDKSIKVWDFKTGQCLQTLSGHTSDIRSVDVSPDSSLAVSASWDKTIKIWDLKKGSCVDTLDGHSGVVIKVALIQDGRRIVSASTSKDLELKVWDLKSGACLRTLTGHKIPAGSPEYGWARVSISQDGKKAVSASDDRALKIWDLESGICLASYYGESRIRCATFSADGQTIAFGEWGGSVNFLQLENGNIDNIPATSTEKPKHDIKPAQTKPKEMEKAIPVSVDPKKNEILEKHGGMEKLSWEIKALYKNQEYDKVIKLGKEMEKCCKQEGDLVYLQFAFGVQADASKVLGDSKKALSLYKQRELICRDLGNKEMLQSALGQQSEIYFNMKEFEEALLLREERLQICRELGNKGILQNALGFVGDTLKAIGDIDEALNKYTERENLCREINDKKALQNAIAQQAFIYYLKKDFAKAAKLYKEQEGICRELDYKDGVKDALGNQSLMLKRLGDISGSEALQKEKELIR